MKKLYIYITILILGVAFNENTNPQLDDNQIAKKCFKLFGARPWKLKAK